MMPVFVLTGFLGSGKTTILKHWTAQPALANTLVVINEFGQVGLDHRLVTQSEDSATVVMDSGCICCTIRTDLVRTLDQARWRFARQGKRQFDRVIIETTGLADPAPIVQTLMTEPRLTRHYRLQSVLTTVDLLLGEQMIAEHREGQKQVAMADQLLLTKADLTAAVSQSDDSLIRRLKQLNPLAPMAIISQGKAPTALIDTCEAVSPAYGWQASRPALPAGHDHAVNAVCLTSSGIVLRDDVEHWQQQVMDLLGADLFRLKAIVQVRQQGASVDPGTEWLAFQSVQHKAMPTMPVQLAQTSGPASLCSAFVLIGRHLSYERLAPTFTDALRLTELVDP